MTSKLVQQREFSLVAHVARLAHSGMPAAEFYAQFVDCIPVPHGTLGVVAWVCAGDSFSKLATSSRTLNETLQLAVSPAEHADQLDAARNQQATQIFDPPPPVDYQVFVENATPTNVVFPIVVDGSVPVVVETFLPPDVHEAALTTFVKQTELLCDLASTFHESSTAIANINSSSGLTPAVHQSLNVRSTCYSIANEGRRAIGCDRVTVLTERGGRFTVAAVSGQESITPRANTIQLLQRLVNTAMQTAEPFWYPESADHLPPEIEDELEAYLEISLARRLGILPLQVIPPRTDSETDDSDASMAALPIVGALVVEQFTDTATHDSLVQRSSMVVREGSVALQNASDHEQIFLLPVWRFLGNMQKQLLGRNLTKSLVASACGLCFLLAMVFIPAELKVACEGRLMPEIRRNVFAPEKGIVEQLHVKHNSHVDQGQDLATITSPDHEMAMKQTEGELHRLEKELNSLTRLRLTERAGSTDDSDLHSAEARSAELKVAIEGMHEQLLIQQEKSHHLAVTAPIDGSIITWDLQRQLQSRPVDRGQVMMQVAQLDGPWILELHIPDRRIADVLKAQRDQDARLRVTYRLASETSKVYEGTISEIALTTRLDAERGQNVLVRVAVDNQPELRQPFTEAQAKIHCGKRPLGVVWLRDVWYFLKSNLWFRFT